MTLRDGQKPAAASSGKLAELLGVRLHVPVQLEVGGKIVTGVMRVLSRAENAQVDASARAFMATYELAGLAPSAIPEWNAEVAVRTLAIAVRDHDDPTKPLDSLEQWREVVTDEQIGSLNEDYKDLVNRLDPIGADEMPLTKDELAAMRTAVKKKDVSLLRSYGSRKLALFATTSDEPPPT